MVRLLPRYLGEREPLTSPTGALIVWLPAETAMLALLAPLSRYNVPPVPCASV